MHAVAAPGASVVAAQAGGYVAPGDATPADTFESLNREAERVRLFEAADEADALNLIDTPCAAGATARACEVERDCGLFDRAETPQHHPPVARFRADGVAGSLTAAGLGS